MTKHQRIIFNGNGYSEEWKQEAARRGLPNIPSSIEAAKALTTEKSIRLFGKFGIFTEAELQSREEVVYETYAKTINIEALTMIDMAKKQLLPAVVGYTKTVADTVLAVKEAGVEPVVQRELLQKLSAKLEEANDALHLLEEKLVVAGSMTNQKELAFYYKDEIMPAMTALRAPVDALEMLVDKKVWPIPTYSDLIFEV